jgi:hypothetical protein
MRGHLTRYDNVGRVRVQVERKGKQGQVGYFGHLQRGPAGQDGNHVAFANDEGQSEELGDSQGDPSGKP